MEREPKRRAARQDGPPNDNDSNSYYSRRFALGPSLCDPRSGACSPWVLRAAMAVVANGVPPRTGDAESDQFVADVALRIWDASACWVI